MLCIIFFQHSGRFLLSLLASCGTHMLSCAHIKIQIDQQFPIIHFSSGGNTVTKHKWPSSCLMSMIIILAICQSFPQLLMWDQRPSDAADTLTSARILLILHLHSLFFQQFFLILVIPSKPLNPPPPTPFMPEPGKVSLWKQGAEAAEGCLWRRWGDRRWGEKKTRSWPVQEKTRGVTNFSYLPLKTKFLLRALWSMKASKFLK